MTDNRALRGLYGITPDALLDDEELLLRQVGMALAGGMKILQYRNKRSDLPRRLEQAGHLKNLCQSHNALFIINDDIEMARAVAADGVHLGREDKSIARARGVLGPSAIIGCSCYNQLQLAEQAQRQGADYIAFGRFFASRTKPAAVQAQPSLLPQARTRLAVPICAIGGISASNATQLISQGADMVAVIHDLFSAGDIFARAQQFTALFD